uniref:Uncharacterized protein n=1 Tax=Setaria viridis TaxID=4556 RepID=A0A4U6SZR1_SETVI|nr:hypothetical protein SEVIR_9G196433v2 [Setaria viridis]
MVEVGAIVVFLRREGEDRPSSSAYGGGAARSTFSSLSPLPTASTAPQAYSPLPLPPTVAVPAPPRRSATPSPPPAPPALLPLPHPQCLLAAAQEHTAPVGHQDAPAGRGTLPRGCRAPSAAR